MVKKYGLISFIGLLITTVYAQDIKLDQAKLGEIKQSYKILKLPNISIVDGVDKGDIYFLKVNPNSKKGSRTYKTFIDKKTGMVYVGEAYDPQGKLMVFPKDKKTVDEGISFSYGNGKNEIYVVTDPECPYCTRFEQAAVGKLGDYTVHVIFYPLPFHKKAPAMIEWIMQGKNDKEKREKMEAVMLKHDTAYQMLLQDEKKPFIYSQKIDEAMGRSMRAVEELEANGTPTVYDTNFTMIPWQQLLTQ